MDLITLQVKSPELVKFYMIAVGSVFVLGLLFFVINKRFRRFVIGYCRNHPWFVGLLTSFYLLYLISRIFYVDTLFLWLFYEDGVFEYLTTVFFIIAAIFFLLRPFKNKHHFTAYTKLFIFGMALFCFVLGMEEISWGQRILGFETPEEFEKINVQGETTIHNLVHPEYHPILYLLFSLGLLIFFIFSSTKYQSLFGIDKIYLPSKDFLVIGLLLPLISLYNMEHFEVILSYMFCVYGYQLWENKL
jgi:hypothetical protein